MNVIPFYPDGSDEATRPARGAVAALDVGSTQIVCMVGEIRREGRGHKARQRLAITGAGTRVARGVKGGVVVDVRAAETAIRLAVEAAERMAGTQVRDVWVNLSGGGLRVETLRATLHLGGRRVERAHLAAARARALHAFDPGTRMLVQAVPAGFSLDGGPWQADPVGLHGDVLAARVNVLTMMRGTLRNLEEVLARSHLRAVGFMAAPVAAAEAVLSDDERELGAVVVDIGAAQSAWAAFAAGMLQAGGALPLGGHHITQDIAAGLHTPVSEAERLKTLHGSTLPGRVDDGELLSIPVLGEDGPGGWQQVPKATLGEIIRPRMEEILELLRDALTPLPAMTRQRVVLCGGGSQLLGVRELAEEVLGARVRVGRTGIIAGLPKMLSGPAHAVAAGLLLAAARPDAQGYGLWREARRTAAANDSGYFDKVRRWFRESF